MQKIIVEKGQTQADLALQHYGSIASVLDLCLDNAWTIGQDIQNVKFCWIDPQKVMHQQLVAFFSDQHITPISGDHG